MQAASDSALLPGSCATSIAVRFVFLPANLCNSITKTFPVAQYSPLISEMVLMEIQLLTSLCFLEDLVVQNLLIEPLAPRQVMLEICFALQIFDHL